MKAVIKVCKQQKLCANTLDIDATQDERNLQLDQSQAVVKLIRLNQVPSQRRYI
jgi:hypothetical protein